MQVDELPTIDPHVDYTQILPIQQKRTVAFINHFVMSTVSFLNTFAQSCESRLMEFEYKLQKVEASLLILESQLSSIPGLDDVQNNNVVSCVSNDNDVRDSTEATDNVTVDLPTVTTDIVAESESKELVGTKYCDDPRYARFFKMVQVGVPSQAVKLKMRSEGIDSSILDTPNAIVESPIEQDIPSDTSCNISSASSSN